MKNKICFPFVGDTIGGSHRSSLLLIQELRHRNLDVVIVVHETGILYNELLQSNIEVLVLPIKTPLRYLRSLQFLRIVYSISRICYFISCNRLNLVHINDARVQMLWAIPCWICRVPAVWHQRTLFSDSRIMRTLADRFATRIISISNVVHNSLTTKSRQNSRVIYNPVSIEPIDRDLVKLKRSYILNQASIKHSQSFIVGFFGNLRLVKRPMVFIEAARLLSSFLDPIILFCVFGEDRENFIPLMKSHAHDAGFTERLFFFGFQSKIEPWIAACDLTISTSVGEGFGRVLAESMAVGTPVLASNSGGHKEIIQHNVNGLLAPPEDPNAIASLTTTYITDHQLRKRIISAGLKSVKKYDVLHHAGRMMSVYNEVLR